MRGTGTYLKGDKRYRLWIW